MASLLIGLCGLAGAEAATPVAVTEVEERPWQQSVALHGTLTSPRDADVTPRVAGLVERVAVEAGDRVAAGDTLIVLDRRLDQLTLETLVAERTSARARLAEAQRLAEEARQLSDSRAIASTELAARQAEVQAQQASVNRLSAEIERQREVIDRHVVVAPFDGVVRERRVEPGEYVGTGAVVAGLVVIDRLRVDIAAPQQYFGLIRPGMPMRLRTEAAAGETREANVDVIVPAAGATARSFLVRAFIPNEDAALVPGMSVRGIFDIRTPAPVVQVPRDALTRVPGGEVRVWAVAVGDDGTPRAVKRQVTLGRSAGGMVEVSAGLSAGQDVIVRGNETLSEGQAIEISQRLPGRPDEAVDGQSAVLPEARAGPALATQDAYGLTER